MKWIGVGALVAGCTLDPQSHEVESAALTPPLTITPRATAIGEAGDNAFMKIRMNARPVGPVTLLLTSSHPSEARVVPSSVTFTPTSWQGLTTIEIIPVDDAVFDGDVPITISARIERGAYAGYGAHVEVLSVDDDYTITGYRATKFVGEAETMPVAINNRSQIALDIRMPDDSLRPFLWENGTLTDLNPTGTYFMRARSMNDAGAVIGTSTAPGSGSFIYQDGVLRPASATTLAINELDHEVGHQFLCKEGLCAELVSEEDGIGATGLALNNSDVVTGRYSRGDGSEAAFYWTPLEYFGVFTDLGGSPRGEGLGINEHGHAVGRRFDANFNYQAFLYANGTLTELGTATGSAGGTAVAINNRGDIVGSDYDTGGMPVAGWIGRPGNLTSLQSLFVDGTCLSMIEVIDVNDRGQIIARGWECNVGSPISFLFEPIKAAR